MDEVANTCAPLGVVAGAVAAAPEVAGTGLAVCAGLGELAGCCCGGCEGELVEEAGGGEGEVGDAGPAPTWTRKGDAVSCRESEATDPWKFATSVQSARPLLIVQDPLRYSMSLLMNSWASLGPSISVAVPTTPLSDRVPLGCPGASCQVVRPSDPTPRTLAVTGCGLKPRAAPVTITKMTPCRQHFLRDSGNDRKQKMK